MSFQQGLSGLNSSSKALDVVSNNISNANTVGFKSSATHFADVYANWRAGKQPCAAKEQDGGAQQQCTSHRQ